MKRSNTPADFWKHVDVKGPDYCWPWKLSKNPQGYGWAYMGTKGHNRYLAHRLAFKLANGTLPILVSHSCDNPPCCNPKHLHAGTWASNNAERIARGRHTALKGERNGSSKLTAKDARIVREMDAQGVSQIAIAKKFGVSESCIWFIRHGKHWVNT